MVAGLSPRDCPSLSARKISFVLYTDESKVKVQESVRALQPALFCSYSTSIVHIFDFLVIVTLCRTKKESNRGSCEHSTAKYVETKN